MVDVTATMKNPEITVILNTEEARAFMNVINYLNGSNPIFTEYGVKSEYNAVLSGVYYKIWNEIEDSIGLSYIDNFIKN